MSHLGGERLTTGSQMSMALDMDRWRGTRSSVAPAASLTTMSVSLGRRSSEGTRSAAAGHCSSMVRSSRLLTNGQAEHRDPLPGWPPSHLWLMPIAAGTGSLEVLAHPVER